MKRLLLSLFLSPVCCFGQSLPELIARYERECSQIVKDTVSQRGIVSYEKVPVVGPNGRVLRYTLGSADTVWRKADCPEFKFGASRMWLTPSAYYPEDTEVVSGDKVRMEIVRPCACDVRLRKVEPFGEHFWEWAKKQ